MSSQTSESLSGLSSNSYADIFLQKAKPFLTGLIFELFLDILQLSSMVAGVLN